MTASCPAVGSTGSLELCLSRIPVSTRSTVIVYSLSNCGRPSGDRLQTAEQRSSPVTLQPASHAFLTAARPAGAGSQAEQLQSASNTADWGGRTDRPHRHAIIAAAPIVTIHPVSPRVPSRPPRASHSPAALLGRPVNTRRGRGHTQGSSQGSPAPATALTAAQVVQRYSSALAFQSEHFPLIFQDTKI